MNGDGTLTTFVEVGFQQREDVDFAWIIPIPDVIPVDEVETADAMLFNELELATAPMFDFQFIQVNRNYNYGYGGYGGYGSRPTCPRGRSTPWCSPARPRRRPSR